VNFLRAPYLKLSCPAQGNCTKTYLRRTRWRGARILLSVDDLLLSTAIEEEAFRQRLVSLPDRLGLLRHPTKGFWGPVQVVHYLGINTRSSPFYVGDGRTVADNKLEGEA
jgi:hypothetical protein